MNYIKNLNVNRIVVDLFLTKAIKMDIYALHITYLILHQLWRNL